MSKRLNLKFVPLHEPKLLPRKYVEQIKNRDWEVDTFYEYNEHLKGNPTNLLFAAVNDDSIIKGFLWMVFDPFTKCLVVSNYSIDTDLQGGGAAIRFVRGFVRKVLRDLQIEKAVWLTDRPKAFERYGFKRSKNVLMELKI